MTIDDIKIGMLVVCEEKQEETNVLHWARNMDDYIGKAMLITDIDECDNTVLCYLCDGSDGPMWFHPEWLEPYETNYIHYRDPDGKEIFRCASCDVEWWFDEGGLEENELFFCPKCGRKVKGVIEE